MIIVSHRWEGDVGTTVTSPQELDAFMAAHPDSFAAYDYRIPTGVFLQSFEFLNSNNVEMAGFVWQTYGPEIPDQSRGASSCRRQWKMPTRPRRSGESSETASEQIGWYFSGTFRQNFDYHLYPFDRQDIWLRLWPPEPVEGVVARARFRRLPRSDAELAAGHRYRVRLWRLGSAELRVQLTT